MIVNEVRISRVGNCYSLSVEAACEDIAFGIGYIKLCGKVDNIDIIKVYCSSRAPWCNIYFIARAIEGKFKGSVIIILVTKCGANICLSILFFKCFLIYKRVARKSFAIRMVFIHYRNYTCRGEVRAVNRLHIKGELVNMTRSGTEIAAVAVDKLDNRRISTVVYSCLSLTFIC